MNKELDLVAVLELLLGSPGHEVEGLLGHIRLDEYVALLHSVHSPIFSIADLV